MNRATATFPTGTHGGCHGLRACPATRSLLQVLETKLARAHQALKRSNRLTPTDLLPALLVATTAPHTTRSALTKSAAEPDTGLRSSKAEQPERDSGNNRANANIEGGARAAECVASADHRCNDVAGACTLADLLCLCSLHKVCESACAVSSAQVRQGDDGERASAGAVVQAPTSVDSLEFAQPGLADAHDTADCSTSAQQEAASRTSAAHVGEHAVSCEAALTETGDFVADTHMPSTPRAVGSAACTCTIVRTRADPAYTPDNCHNLQHHVVGAVPVATPIQHPSSRAPSSLCELADLAAFAGASLPDSAWHPSRPRGARLPCLPQYASYHLTVHATLLRVWPEQTSTTCAAAAAAAAWNALCVPSGHAGGTVGAPVDTVGAGRACAPGEADGSEHASLGNTSEGAAEAGALSSARVCDETPLPPPPPPPWPFFERDVLAVYAESEQSKVRRTCCLINSS